MKARRGYRTSLAALGIAAGGLASAAIGAGQARAEDGFLDYVKPIANARVRYEFVDQDNFKNNANAVTARARVGLETVPIYGFAVLAEGEFTGGLNNAFNSTTNGRTAYPVVPDPDNAELNRLQISYSSEWVTGVLGRQRIIYDNARFVGNVGFRQNEQTFDAVTGTVMPLPGLSATYTYVDRVQTIFGNDSANADYQGQTQFIRAGYSGLDWLDAVAYGYLIDLDERPALSSQTYGVRAVGTFPVENNTSLLVTAEYARQSDYRNNPGEFGLNYFHGQVGANIAALSASAGFEILGGNGTSSFSTPLATLHKFQGWADVFLSTPADGIRDVYGQVGYTFPGFGPFNTIAAKGVFHTFDTDNGSDGLGNELDFSVKGVMDHGLSLTAAYATYRAPSNSFASAYPSRNKLWLQVDFAY